MCVWDGSSHAPVDLSNHTCRRISTSAMISTPDNCCCIVHGLALKRQVDFFPISHTTRSLSASARPSVDHLTAAKAVTARFQSGLHLYTSWTFSTAFCKMFPQCSVQRCFRASVFLQKIGDLTNVFWRMFQVDSEQATTIVFNHHLSFHHSERIVLRLVLLSLILMTRTSLSPSSSRNLYFRRDQALPWRLICQLANRRCKHNEDRCPTLLTGEQTVRNPSRNMCQLSCP